MDNPELGLSPIEPALLRRIACITSDIINIVKTPKLFGTKEWVTVNDIMRQYNFSHGKLSGCLTEYEVKIILTEAATHFELCESDGDEKGSVAAIMLDRREEPRR